MGYLLNEGERGLLVGMTGSGKTQNGLFHLRNTDIGPAIIFDTKIDNGFHRLPEGRETMTLIRSLEEYEKYAKRQRREIDDFVLVRPSNFEMNSQELLDEYCRLSYQRFGPALFFFDELYNWHVSPQGGPWFRAMLTRGRSKKKTVLAGTQRPAHISRFCLTEAQKFYIHFLSDKRDHKSLASVIPELEITLKRHPLPKHHFYFYEQGKHGGPVLYEPVPMQTVENRDYFRPKIF